MANIFESKLKSILLDLMDIFRAFFSAWPPANLPPLRIELTPDAKPVKVSLRKYSKEQKEFMHEFFKNLVAHKMAYPNPTSR